MAAPEGFSTARLYLTCTISGSLAKQELSLLVSFNAFQDLHLTSAGKITTCLEWQNYAKSGNESQHTVLQIAIDSGLALAQMPDFYPHRMSRIFPLESGAQSCSDQLYSSTIVY